jgi:spore coat protein A
MNLKTTFTAWFVTTVVTISLSNSGGVTADPAMNGLLDPDSALFFVNEVPNALDPSFMFKGKEKKYKTKFKIKVSENDHWAGLLDADGERLMTKIWGYAPLKGDSTWPGKTFQVKKHEKVFVKWMNKLPVGPHLVTNLTNEVDVIDRSLHWAYGLPCCNKDSNPPYTVDDDGVPIVVHLHGGHTDAKYDGPPEVFFSRDFRKRGPRWKTKTYRYDNSQTAGTLWYHDHALGKSYTAFRCYHYAIYFAISLTLSLHLSWVCKESHA